MWCAEVMENWSDEVMEWQRLFYLERTEKATEKTQRVLDLTNTPTLRYSNRQSTHGIAIHT
jgi:hypothetical protein